MARRRTGEVPYPARLLDDVSWTFRGEPFRDQRAFFTAVRKENGRGWTAQWLQQIVLRVPRVRIRPDVWLWDEEDEPTLELTPDNGTVFTGGELLFKIHNAWVAVLRRMDHKYFEGLALAEKERGLSPLYELELGS